MALYQWDWFVDCLEVNNNCWEKKGLENKKALFSYSTTSEIHEPEVLISLI